MRKELRDRVGTRTTFTGTVARFGTKSADKGPDIPTLMLEDVRDNNGQPMTDHVWMSVGRRMEALHLAIGDVVMFRATIASYVKGYREDAYTPIEIDYRLSNPTHIRRVEIEHESEAS